MKFNPGQQGLCIDDSYFTDKSMHPKIDQVVKIIAYDCPTGSKMVSIEGYLNFWYDDDHFEPLISDEELSIELEEINCVV